MLSALIAIFTFILILICVLLVLVILMQRPSADAGMGASLAGGAAESAFGGETGNVLTRVCVRCIVVFFVLTFSLYLANLYLKASSDSAPDASASIESAISNLVDGETAAAQENKDAAKAQAESKAQAATAEAAKAAESKSEGAKAEAGKKAEQAPAQQAK